MALKATTSFPDNREALPLHELCYPTSERNQDDISLK